MPFLNRQEMALIFVAVAILAITNPRWSRRRRQAALIVATVGMEISHYSTTYVFLGTLVIAWIAGQLVLVGRFRRKRSTPVPDDRKRRWAGTRLTIGVWCIVAVGAITVTWGEFVTHVASGAADEIASAVSGFIEHSGGPKSSAVTYGLFSGKSESLQSELNEYREQTLQVRSTAPLGTYLPEKVVAAYATPVVSEPNLRLTGIGRYLSSVGVPPATVNNDVRQLAAKGEQIFVVIGLLAIILIRRRNRAVGWEFYCLGLGGLVMLVLITVLPNLSVEYGVLRVFQEELIFIAPILVIGSITLFRPLGNTWSLRIAMTLCVLFLISTTGLMPQVLGGYPAQLNLNNSGTYYDIYYMHPQEIAAVAWLYGKPGTLPGGNSGRCQLRSFRVYGAVRGHRHPIPGRYFSDAGGQIDMGDRGLLTFRNGSGDRVH